MSPEQIKLARHALGLPNKRRQSYRNYFVTGAGSEDYRHWCNMVVQGAARRRAGSPLTGGDDIFHLTLAGATAALRQGERLDLRLAPEDFRS